MDEPADFPIVAGRLCLDFINTEVRSPEGRRDLLPKYQDLIVWARQAGALDSAEAGFVLERWPDGDEAGAALESARRLRAELRRTAEELMAGRPVPPSAIEAINAALRSRPGYLQLEPGTNEWAARWKVPLRRADDVLWRVARSAASLLTDDDPALIKRCERKSCGLFFYDTTRNHRKRWCRMDVCGAAIRSAAYYQRRKPR
jgi:predicted RNA-binding Zn ribbon-like protein